MQPAIFGISGLRGVVGTELTPEAICQAAVAFGSLVGPGTVAVGRDSRPSGEMLTAAATAGLLSCGCNVEQLGICPTPTVLHHARTRKLAGGIVITASHNPEQWNGMKFAGSDGLFLLPDEVARLRAIIDALGPARAEWNRIGESRQYDEAVADHVRVVVGSELFSPIRRGRPERRLRVGIDAVNGAAAAAAVLLVEELGAEPVTVNCSNDPEQLRSGFPRRPQPTAENLVELARLVKEKKLDFGVGFDPDGDRAGFVDETGTPLGEEITICLACHYVLPRHPGPVVVNLSTTRAVEDVCSQFSAPVERSSVGEIAVAVRMKELNAVLGGEGNGGVILPEVNFTRDGLVATACVLGLLSTTGRSLSELRSGIPRYRMTKTTVPLDRERFEERRARLVAEFENARVDERDGIRLDGPDYWVHIRPSNTEPLVRVIAETSGDTAPEELAGRATRVLSE